VKDSKTKPTIKTIAQIVGVSHFTVSHALRDLPDVSEKTKQKIKAVAA
jgi:DNA-binding LacI/PurR family transcriptional regulator